MNTKISHCPTSLIIHQSVKENTKSILTKCFPFLPATTHLAKMIDNKIYWMFIYVVNYRNIEFRWKHVVSNMNAFWEYRSHIDGTGPS